MNKKQSLLRYLSVALCSLIVSTTAFAVEEPFGPVKAIVGRLAGGYSSTSIESGADTAAATAAMEKFEFAQDASLGQSAKVGPGTDGKIRITAANAAGASFGLGQYLRNDAKVHLSWCGNNVSDYTNWPVPESEKTYTPSTQLRMAYNYCTISYTMAFWNQRQWREELDRLALNGFNGALVMHGLGKVWKETLTDMGYTTDEIQKFIPDAATWAWWNMGNIEGIGGPVSDAQLEQDAAMAKWMYAAMKEIGIEPLVQAFVGLVPSTSQRAMAAKYPLNTNGSHYTLLGQNSYQGLMRPWVLHGANVASGATGDNYSLPAFDDFAAAWYKHLAEVYDFETAGSPLYLGGDLFHEGGSTYGVDVTRYAKKIQSVQQQYYPGVKWILQYWGTNPSQAFVNDLAANLTIIECLDLNMHTSGAYSSPWKNSSGVKFPWLWCEVMNFGGNTGMYGGVTRFRNVTKIGVGDSTFLGWGLLSEGLETNPMVYDIMMEQMHQPSDDTMDDSEFATFMDNYLVRRYGQKDANVRAAVQKLAETVLNTKRSQQGVLESVLCANPKKCPVTQVSSWGPSGAIEYDRTELYSVAEAYLEAARSASYKDLEVFKYDFAELFLQLISDRAREINGLTLTSKSARNEFRKLIDLAERLLASSDRWRLDWHEGRTDGAADETAAVRGYRRMVTTWVEHNNRGQGTLPEYAHRAYAGLIKDYYGKRWNLFFDKTEGTISESDYTAAINTLDSAFPTAKLTATAAGDLVAIGEEIMETLIPPAYAWTGAGNDGDWATSANWSFKEQATAYENGYDVTLPVDGATITASAPVTTGAITLGSASQDLTGLSATKTYNTAFIPAAAESIGWTGVTLADLLNGRYTGVMGGGWMGSNKNLACVGYFPTLSADGQTVTVQFHGLLDNYTRCVAVEFTIVDGEVHAKAAWVKNASGDVRGVKNFKSTDANGTRDTPTVATSDSTGAYGLKAISLYPSATLTLAGPITVGGALTIQAQEAVSFTGTEPTFLPEVVFANGGSLSAPNVTMIESVSVEANGGILELGATQELEIGSVTTASDVKLVIKAPVEALTGESGLPRVKAPREAISSMVFIGLDGEVKSLTRDASGYLKCAIGTLTYDAFLTATATKTTWKNVTLDDLAACEFTACMTGGYFGNKEGGVVVSYRHVASRGAIITKTASSLTLQMQCVDDGWLKVVPLTFTIGADGFVYVQAATGGAQSGGAFGTSVTGTTPLATAEDDVGYGIHELVVKPAVATVPAIKANYSSLADAVDGATGGKKIVLTGDAKVSSVLNKDYKIWIEIPHDVVLTSEVGYFLRWDKSYQLDIYGVLNLGGYGFYFNNTPASGHTEEINVYAGAEIYSTHAKGVAVWGASTINVKANADFDTVDLNTIIQGRESVTLNVEEGVTAKLSGNFKTKDGADSTGIANPVLTKSGSGTLEFAGSLGPGSSLTLAAGTLTRKLAPEATFTMTVNGGTPNILPTDEEDYEINDDEGENNVHTYTSTAIPWVFYVTPAGATTDAAAGGVKFRTLEEALAKRAEWGPTAKIWVIRGVHTTLPDGYELNDGSAGSEVIVPVPRLYYASDTTEWTQAVKVANSKDGECTVETQVGDIITFDKDESFKTLYIHGNPKDAQKVLASGFELAPNSKLSVGYEGSNASIPERWTVTVNEGALLKFDNWANGQPVKVMNATFNGAGTVTFGTTITSSSEVTFGTIKGDATITIPAGVTVNVTGSIENPIAGAGTIKISGEESLTFAAGSTVTVQHEDVNMGYYATTSVVENADGTTTKTYSKVENIDANAFGIKWYDSDTGSVYVGPETAGGDAKWDVGANWLSVDKDGVVGARRTGAPYKGNPYNYSLFNGDYISNVTPDANGVKHITADKLDFWRVRLGLTNKVDVTINEVDKFQTGASAFIYVDPTSKLTIKKVTNWKGDTIDLHSAAPEGIVFEGMNGNVWNFYLEGEGTVQFNCQLSGSSHKVKYAEVDLGEGDGKYVKSKKLVGFTSIHADAYVTLANDAKIKAADGTTMTAGVVSATAEVGTCAIRKGADGFYLDFVGRRSLYNEWRPIEDNNWTTAANWSWGEVPESGATMVKVIGGEVDAVNLVCPSEGDGTANITKIWIEGIIRLVGKLHPSEIVTADELRIADGAEVYFQNNYVGIRGKAKIVFETSNSKITNASWPAIGGEVTVVVEEGVTATFFNVGCIYGSANGKVIKQGFGTLKFGMEFGRASREEKDWLGNLEIQEGIVEINGGCVENVYGDGKLKATTAKATNLTIKSLKSIMMIDMGEHTDGTTTLSTITMAEGADLDLTCGDNCCLTYEINGDKHPVVSSGSWGFAKSNTGDNGSWTLIDVADTDIKTSPTTKTRKVGSNGGILYAIYSACTKLTASFVAEFANTPDYSFLVSVADSNGDKRCNIKFESNGNMFFTKDAASEVSDVVKESFTNLAKGKHYYTLTIDVANKLATFSVDGAEVLRTADITLTNCGRVMFGSNSGTAGNNPHTWWRSTGTIFYSASVACGGSTEASATSAFKLPAAFSKVSELEKAQLTLEYLNGANGRVEVPGAYSIEGKSVITDIAKIAEMETLLGKNTGSKVTDLSMPFVPAEQTGDTDSVSIAVNLSADLKGGKLVLVTSTTPNGKMTEVEGQVKTTPKAGTQTFTLDSITDSMGEGKVLYFKVKAEANK